MTLNPKTSPAVTLLPLLLLAAMVVLGLVLEPVLYGVFLWQTKLPLIALLALAFLRCTSSSRS
ncbi:MAG TPA: hypothetical protein VJ725_34465 [Thermoanaerobaculia bacterium]|nr:hypothetical protein [Thermoanaerobaculia bacterium]